MARLLWAWTASLLLASWAVLGANEVGPLSILSMDWKLENRTALTVCASPGLDGGNVTLVVNDPNLGLKDYVGSVLSENTSCADFSDDTLQLPDEVTSYELVLADSDSGVPLLKGLVSYSISMAQTIINCAETEFVRVSISSGSFVDGFCVPGETSSPQVCYVPAEDPRVCVLGLDQSSEGLQVCVTQQSTDVAPLGDFTAATLRYEDGSFAMQGGVGTLTELLHRQGQGTTSVTSCSSDVCTLATFVPSTDTFQLCGVYLDNSDAVLVCLTEFQDLKVTVVTTDPILDFYLFNLYQEEKYDLFSGPDENTVLEGDSTTLDCTATAENSPCYGFLVTTDNYLAVSYTNGTEAIISNTSISASTSANLGAGGRLLAAAGIPDMFRAAN